MSTIYGIDVSKHQGAIDWNRVYAAGKRFVFVRLGWCGYDGAIAANDGLDPLFESNVTGAAAAGLEVGAYVYSYARTADAARIAAREALALAAPHTLTYPVAFDIEDALYLSMSAAENTAIAAAFLSAVDDGGYYPMLYTYKNFAENNLNMAELAAYDFWLAEYAADATYAGNFRVWQYAGETGAVDGVSGPCDLDVSYDDYAAIIRQAGNNGLTGQAGAGAAAQGALEGARAGADAGLGQS